MTILQEIKISKKQHKGFIIDKDIELHRYLKTFKDKTIEITCDGIEWIKVDRIEGMFGDYQFYIEDDDFVSCTYIDLDDVIDIREVTNGKD